MEELLQQLIWEPSVERAQPTRYSTIIVGGMGGSALAGHALSFLGTGRNVIVHEAYDVPPVVPADALFVAVSYSGNTEETLSFARAVQQHGLPGAAVASGGALEEIAERTEMPFVRVPEGLAPRNALLHLTRAVLALLDDEESLAELAQLHADTSLLFEQAAMVSEAVANTIPVVYASNATEPLARIWTTFLSESAKIPTFASIIPSSNHYELQGLDKRGPHAALAQKLAALLLRDPRDDARVRNRFAVLEALLHEQGLATWDIPMEETTRAAQLVHSWLLAWRTTETFAQSRGIDARTVPLTSEFKRRL